VTDPGDKAMTTPKLDVVIIDTTLSLLDGLFIVGADDCIETDKMAVKSDGIGSIVGPSSLPPCQRAAVF
jgi:hypothetical protein